MLFSAARDEPQPMVCGRACAKVRVFRYLESIAVLVGSGLGSRDLRASDGQRSAVWPPGDLADTSGALRQLRPLAGLRIDEEQFALWVLRIGNHRGQDITRRRPSDVADGLSGR